MPGPCSAGEEHAAGPDDRDYSRAKRRKTRKGTHSCWACKRRKERCLYSTDQSVCDGCKRRGTRCISQDLPDDMGFSAPPDGARQMGERVVRVEAILSQLMQRFSDGETARSDHQEEVRYGQVAGISLPTPALTVETALSHPTQDLFTPETSSSSSWQQQQSAPVRHKGPIDNPALTSAARAPERYTALSRTLHAALPSLRDSNIICKASHRCFYMFDEILTIPTKTLNQNGLQSPESILLRPTPDAHPVLLARHMLQLAHILQQFHPRLDEDIKQLSEPPRELQRRLAETAISLVSTQERLLGSIEGLECVMLESMYYANCGSLRLSWAAGRRAMHLAQLMSFHHHLGRSHLRCPILDPQSRNADPSFMWFRIVHYDRYLCLMLGLPQGSNDHSMAAEALLKEENPVGRLERVHSVVAARILEDKESTSHHHGEVLQQLDKELQKASRSMPSRWWLTPNLANDTAKSDSDLFWDLKRLIVQMFHYNLLNQLHLPHMLRPSPSGADHNSKLACVNASREILSRFVVLRNFNRIAFNCRTSDFMALMAAMTLLLAHLDSHRRCAASPSRIDPLVYQYPSDRAMMEQVQESMEEVSRLHDGDVFSTQSADLLRRLLIIDQEAADGQTADAPNVSIDSSDAEMGFSEGDIAGNTDGVVRVSIPYFGVIKISSEGALISREGVTPGIGPVTSNDAVHSVPEPTTRGADHATSGYSALEEAVAVDATPNGNLVDPTVANFRFLDGTLPGLTAEADDWAFQGVDMAFFDNLLGSDALDSTTMTW